MRGHAAAARRAVATAAARFGGTPGAARPRREVDGGAAPVGAAALRARRSRFGVAALMARDLFVGVTTWNSATLLPASLASIRRHTDERRTRLMILDNFSTDATVDIARSFDADVLQRRSGQAAALMDLFNASRSELTLLVD